MKNMTLEHIAQAAGGRLIGKDTVKQICVTGITTDSRKIEKGCLFVPIVGARVDGHTFIPDVINGGAAAVLSEQDLEEVNFPYIRVASSLEAVKGIARYYLEQMAIPVVGITGSVGKTSTKEMIAAVLAQKYDVLKTQGNFNNELGLPLTVFNLREQHQIAVLEMGISSFGEMHRLAEIAKPDTCVITNIGCCHLEFLIDRDGVLRAKTEIFDFLDKNGHIVLNGDDDKLRTIKEEKGVVPVFFGIENPADIYADEVESRGFKGISCRIHVGEESFSVLIPVPGRHMVYNALAGTAVGRIYGLSLQEIKRGIESLKPVSGRFHVIEANGLVVVDDCYNANPMSMKASIQILKDGLGRKVAILGDMGELGEQEAALHAEVGAFAAGQQIDVLICVGELCRYMAEAAQKENSRMKVVYIKDREELLGQLSGLIQKGDTVLVKASHFMQFERVVEALTGQ